MSKKPKHEANEVPKVETAEQADFDISTAAHSGPVECFGMTFPSDAARREHFLKELATKLKNPDFRKIEGFPIGEDVDILALSDPPYYTACPNPWLADFVKHNGKPYNPKDKYHREPFAADVSEGKNHPIYNAHSYHTKVPHRAIMRYLLHFTQPGDVVCDVFAGTGMTGVAAHLCGDKGEIQSLGYQVRDDGTVLDERGKPLTKIGPRSTLLIDLSPAATFIAQNYNLSADKNAIRSTGKRLIAELKKQCAWMYKTRDPKTDQECEVYYTIWSDVFGCPECGAEIVFWDAAVDSVNETVRADVSCSSCKAAGLSKARLTRISEKTFDHLRGSTHARAKRVPVQIEYAFAGKRVPKKPDEKDSRLFAMIEGKTPTAYYPNIRIDRDIDLWYERDYRSLGIDNVSDFFSRRALLTLSAFRSLVMELPDARLRTAFAWVLTSVVEGSSLMNRERPGGMPSKLSGTLYIGALIREINVISFIERKIAKMLALPTPRETHCIIATSSSSVPSSIPDETVDYIFVDPPFGSNIIYSDLNILWEGWLGLTTNTTQEAVVHRRKKKDAKRLPEYQSLITSAFHDLYRILKPGRWLTVEFSNTQSNVWNVIQVAIQEAGFVVANVAALDKQQGSFKAVTTPTAVKQDLVISAYKPNGGLEERFAKKGETEDGVWDFIRTHLSNLPVVKLKGGQLDPIAERDARILFDRTVAFYVRHGIPVPISSPEFQTALAEKFPERDSMYFLPDQAAEYDKVRMKVQGIGQLTIFVEDERSAVDWLRNYLKNKPSKYQDIQPEFFEQLNQSWKKWETKPELRALLDQYFLCYQGEGDVPSQIHSYLSTNFKELRTLPADHAMLRAKAHDRWFVPDPRKNADVEQLREKRLLEEFWSYMPPGYEAAAKTRKPNEPVLPGMQQLPPKQPKGKRITIVRTEAVRVGFNFCFARNDYTTIIAVAQHIPDAVINNDEQLQMIYDSAVTRTGGETE